MWTIRGAAIESHADCSIEDAGILAIRPEHLTLADRPSDAASDNAVLVTIDRVIYLGGTTRLKLRTRGGVNLTLSLASQKAAPIFANCGEVWINWPSD